MWRRLLAAWRPLSLTLILISYLLVWLPYPAAGLSLLGVELGEWIKFLPGVRTPQPPASRNWFYLPPITLAWLIVLWSAAWPARRWQTWLARGLALGVSFLAVPALEVIRDEPAAEWRLRLAWIGVLALGMLTAHWWGTRLSSRALTLLAALTAAVGAFMPTWAYFGLRPVVEAALRAPVSVGPGVWLNLLGHSLWLLPLLIGPIPYAPAPGNEKDDAPASS